MSRDDTYEEGREWRRTSRIASFQLFFPSPGDPNRSPERRYGNVWKQIWQIFTRAKKLVWQSSRLAPLVCKFGWAIWVYGGKSGREVYAHSHTHALHTEHIQRRVCACLLMLNYAIKHLNSQSNGLFPSSMSIMATRIVLHFETHHT